MASVESLAAPALDLPGGVQLLALQPHTDQRGELMELYRDGGSDLAPPRQWNLLNSAPGSVRGMHAHLRHTDYVVVLSGVMLLGLCDTRQGFAANSCIVELRGDQPQAAIIPPGVVHGFVTTEGYSLVTGLSHTWNPADDLCCRWDDPALALDWPHIETPALSARDAAAGSLAELAAAWNANAPR
ncbi:hypothetical protein E4634_10135 [Mangrovimicrobium sediminis]|uniref:dTDP-4-dehydrorhamnose 3,5-epimerase n=1 Tax=Mangrovimicrobium sediminis TaxID=2562682 RepID=A0A4Z0M124_9GAMM|nr:dTDP-4-dehydrorhamnose 3,5-epimerase family protein [Haliea sp. SAOS-164]TGD73383.1 hypothetical protein E4634_10135 [Haliea sp. SAOS-164]